MSLKQNAFRPSAERLEDHVLLSTVAPAPASQFSGSPIVETLTTDKTVYKVGQPIRITLTETNTTNADVALPNMTQGGGFAVSRKFKNVWETKRSEPTAKTFTLQPGQTHTIRVTWNGHSNVGPRSHSAPLTGTFQVDNALANNSVSIAIVPAHGKGSKAGVTAAMPDETLSLVD
jgi:hypothetical protein